MPRSCLTALTRLDDVIGGAAIYYLTSLVMFLGVSLGLELLESPPEAWPREAGILEAFDRASGAFYKRIAQDGYSFTPKTASNVAWFPVYPLMARAVAQATRLQTEVALLLVSNLSLVAAFVVLARYLRARPAAENAAQSATQDTAQPEWTLLALGLFPPGCFFRMCYAESTFLLLTVAAMFGLERLGPRAPAGAPRRWLLPAVVLTIGAATATRATGVALLAPLAVHLWQSQTALGARAWRLALWLPLGCWGLFAFMAYQYVQFGDPLAFVDAQFYWRNGPALDGAGKLAALATFEPLRAVYDPQSPTYWAIYDAHGVPWFSLGFANPLYFAAGIALVAIGTWRRWLTLGETALTASLLLIPYLTRSQETGMLGSGRFVAVAFPLYIVMGQLLSRLPTAAAVALLAISAFFLALYSALFAAGYSII